jgi:hypothetical protein
VLFSPGEDENVSIQDRYSAVINLDILYDSGQSSEWAWIIPADYHLLSDFVTCLHIYIVSL